MNSVQQRGSQINEQQNKRKTNKEQFWHGMLHKKETSLTCMNSSISKSASLQLCVSQCLSLLACDAMKLCTKIYNNMKK